MAKLRYFFRKEAFFSFFFVTLRTIDSYDEKSIDKNDNPAADFDGDAVDVLRGTIDCSPEGGSGQSDECCLSVTQL